MTKPERVAAIIAECREQGVKLPEQIAYVLATAEHEAGPDLQPVTEGFYLRNPLRFLRKLRYAPYWGRGLVQLTWRANYAKYQQILGLPLVANPDLALRPDVAIFILVHGMKHGIFTGKRLEDYIRPDHCDFINARRIINGLDRARHIAEIAKDYLWDSNVKAA